MDGESIVFLDRAALPVALEKPAFPHRWVEYSTTATEETGLRLAGATIAITNKVRITEAVLAAAPRLRMVAVAATGTDHIDLAACRRRKVAVANIRRYAVHSVPEHVFMLALALRRQTLAYRGRLAVGDWERADTFCLFSPPVNDLYGSTLGIVGHGSVGRAVAKLGRAFGMRVVVAERRGAPPRKGRTAFEEVLARADVLSLHCPLSAETRGLIGKAELAAMKPSSVLIHTARGGVVDEGALLSALLEGRIAGAGIDVLDGEPPRPGHPLLVADLPNLIVTPHIAWASVQAMQRLAGELTANMEAFVSGKRRCRVV